MTVRSSYSEMKERNFCRLNRFIYVCRYFLKNAFRHKHTVFLTVVASYLKYFQIYFAIVNATHICKIAIAITFIGQ